MTESTPTKVENTSRVSGDKVTSVASTLNLQQTTVNITTAKQNLEILKSVAYRPENDIRKTTHGDKLETVTAPHTSRNPEAGQLNRVHQSVTPLPALSPNPAAESSETLKQDVLRALKTLSPETIPIQKSPAHTPLITHAPTLATLQGSSLVYPRICRVREDKKVPNESQVSLQTRNVSNEKQESRGTWDAVIELAKAVEDFAVDQQQGTIKPSPQSTLTSLPENRQFPSKKPQRSGSTVDRVRHAAVDRYASLRRTCSHNNKGSRILRRCRRWPSEVAEIEQWHADTVVTPKPAHPSAALPSSQALARPSSPTLLLDGTKVIADHSQQRTAAGRPFTITRTSSFGEFISKAGKPPLPEPLTGKLQNKHCHKTYLCPPPIAPPTPLQPSPSPRTLIRKYADMPLPPLPLIPPLKPAGYPALRHDRTDDDNQTLQKNDRNRVSAVKFAEDKRDISISTEKNRNGKVRVVARWERLGQKEEMVWEASASEESSLVQSWNWI